jgi:predicted NBD/HSP70 family sugar kinase
MKRSHFIGLDVHYTFTVMAVVTESGRLTKRQRCPTTIPDLVEALEGVDESFRSRPGTTFNCPWN